jgi:hypothetical protein
MCPHRTSHIRWNGRTGRHALAPSLTPLLDASSVGLVVSHTTQPSQRSWTVLCATQGSTRVLKHSQDVQGTSNITFEKVVLTPFLTYSLHTDWYFCMPFCSLTGMWHLQNTLPQSQNTSTVSPDTSQSLLKSVVFDPVSACFWSRSSILFHAI